MSIEFFRAVFSATFWLTIFLALVFFRKREAAGAIFLAWIMVISSFWTGGILLGLIAKTSSMYEVSLSLTIFGKSFIPILFLAFVFDYCGMKRLLSKKVFLPLGIFPLIIIIFSFHPAWNDLLWTVQPANSDVFTFSSTRGIMFSLHLFYSYSILLTGIIILFRSLKVSVTYFTRHTLIYLLAFIFPVVCTLLHNTGMGVFKYIDISTIGISVAVLIIFFGIYNVREYNIIPAAYKTILETIPEAVLVTNSQERVILANPNFRNLFVQPNIKISGKHVFEIFPELTKALPQKKQTDYSFEFRYNGEAYLISIRYLRKEENIIVGTTYIFQKTGF